MTIRMSRLFVIWEETVVTVTWAGRFNIVSELSLQTSSDRHPFLTVKFGSKPLKGI